MAQQPPKTKEHPEVQAMQEHREERKRQTEEAMKRMESSQPTPTRPDGDHAHRGCERAAGRARLRDQRDTRSSQDA
jgi:hypothetical protein